jgi:MFS family permease
VGLASTGMMFVSQPSHFYVLRFLLGVFEAGFFPGIVLYLTYWFPSNRRAAAISVFFAGVAVAGVLGGLLSGWIMRDMSGVLGLHGWQWMFAIEGAPAIVLACFAFTYLVDRPQDAAWLTPDERRASRPSAAMPARTARTTGAAWRPRSRIRASTCSRSSTSRSPARRSRSTSGCR